MKVYAITTAHDHEIEGVQEDNRTREVMDRLLYSVPAVYATLDGAKAALVTHLREEMVMMLGDATDDEVEGLPVPILTWSHAPGVQFQLWESSYEHDGHTYRLCITEVEVHQ